MTHLDTKFPTIVYDMPIIDPSIMEDILENKNKKKRIHETFYYKKNVKSNILFICDIASSFLDINHFKHNRNIWYIDVIRYVLDKQKKGVDSGLAWHCENDNYDDLITVLLYLHIDDTIKDGNLRYKDKDNVKQTIKIKSGTTIIMDGEVPHKPQNPYGTGTRDLIIVSFKKH
tara:strand:+ start:42 stop:560 length:519 start_codon:yes stop_codon:yes gene_type:complete